ncbi:hypothetical protein MKW94_026420 [Papaver nudicaule]|uniref:Receptor-like serine/threonine-protein kinase n=1 Tax=Papaver nudicaule TaxID=74823 RepID=A0AA41V1F6_PAPNU|nr:hypothetical protein [Papaver nudicaule]
MLTHSVSFTIFSILYSLLLISTVSSTDIELGATLTPNNNQNNWNSSKNTFSLGFIPINDSSFFAFGISFSNVLVWKAGGDDAHAINLDSDSRFEFLHNGNLRLINSVSNRILWQSNTANKGITVATLDESGNLSLKNASNIPVWSTFDNPTNTILPTQYFTTDKILKSGAYSFNLLKSGNLTLSWNTETVYWNKGLNPSVDSTNLIAPYLGLLQTGVFRLFDRTLSSPVTIASTGDYGEGSTDTLRFLRLDSDGNLRIYTSVKGSGVFTQTWAAVQDQCLVYGWCGNMGICSYTESEAVCSCPSRNFEFIDPNDSRKGCKRKVEIEKCPSSPIMMELENTRFLTYPPELLSQAYTNGIVACKSNCLVDSACDASTSLADGSGLCYMKRSKFISGYRSPALISTSFVKVCGPVIPNPPPQCASSSKTFRIRSGVVAVVVLVSLGCVCIIGVCLWFWRYNSSLKYGGHYSLLDYTSGAPIQFSYTDLHRATKRFKDKLGSGGFGSVYKGVLANRTVIAVKRLEGIEQGERQFRMEVAIISSTHHLNLVRLIGFCSESRHRLLVYEFMKNGSLENSLFKVEDNSKKVLNWETRFNIALGTAKGITYLHEECRDCILHCDIKPENILLDESSNAKVSDFGLAKLINPRDDLYETLTSIRGTRGYLAPEWVANLPITSKSDVYSYGMVLLEIVGGRRNFEVSEETGGLRFSVWAYKEFERGNIFNIVDKRLVEQEVDMEQVMRAIQVSFWCIQEQPSQRPKMGKVVQMLEGITPIETAPPPTATTEVSITGSSVTSHASSTGSSVLAPLPSSFSVQTPRSDHLYK